MRLIDADRLKDKLVGLRDYRQVCEIIDNAPTVEMPKVLGTVDKNGDIKLELIRPQGFENAFKEN